MKIKTIRWKLDYAERFDEEVNEALEDGYRLMQRSFIPGFRLDGGSYLHNMLYAELVKVDEAPAPDPFEALRVVRDFCEEMPTEKCLGKCPLTPWCAMYCPQDGMAPADWVIPDEEVDA